MIQRRGVREEEWVLDHNNKKFPFKNKVVSCSGYRTPTISLKDLIVYFERLDESVMF